MLRSCIAGGRLAPGAQSGDRLHRIGGLLRRDDTGRVAVEVDPLGTEGLRFQVTDAAAVVAERGAQVLDLAERRNDVMMDLKA